MDILLKTCFYSICNSLDLAVIVFQFTKGFKTRQLISLLSFISQSCLILQLNFTALICFLETHNHLSNILFNNHKFITNIIELKFLWNKRLFRF